MRPIDWELVESLVHRALQLSPDRRADFIDRISDADVRAEVASLLAAADCERKIDLEEIVTNAAQFLTDQPPILHGALAGRFRIHHLLGTGGMSEVYLAEDVELGRKVALKILPEQFCADAERVQRFRQEAKATSALNHPNIVTVFDIGEFDHRTFIATEYIEGITLTDRVRKGPIPLVEALEIAEQLASALVAAHEKGVLHRDIKPDNIMLRHDGVLKVLDFGLARMTAGSGIDAGGAQTLPGVVLGTPSYMSPEQARGGKIDARSDLWSFAAVLYELLTRQVAFSGPSTSDIIVSVLERDPVPPSRFQRDLPTELEQTVMRMLAKHPDRRIPTAAAALEAIRSVRERQTQSKELDKPRSKTVRRRWFIAAAIILGVSILSVWLIQLDSGRKRVQLQQITTTLSENRVTAAAVTPDGRTLVWAALDGAIHLRSTESGNSRALPFPTGFFIDRISLLPDGSAVLISGFAQQGQQRRIWRVSIADGTSRLLHENARTGVVSSDGRLIAFTNPRQSEILLMDSEGASIRKLMVGGSQDTFPVLFWSGAGRLSFHRRQFAPKLGQMPLAEPVQSDYQTTLGTVDVAGGRLLVEEASPWMRSACALNDGRLLYITQDDAQQVFSWNVWELDTDSTSGRLKGRPRRLTTAKDTHMMELACSADGKFVAVLIDLSRSIAAVADLEPGPRLSQPRALMPDEQPQYVHEWTPDSRAVLYERGVPDETGRVVQWDIYLQRLGDLAARPIATSAETEYFPVLTPDGVWILYLSFDEKRGRATQKLFRVPVNGGRAEIVPVESFDEIRCAGPGGNGCVLRVTENRQHIFFDLHPIRGRQRELARKAMTPGLLGDWAISMDGNKVALPKYTTSEAGIRVFRLRGAEDSEEFDISVPGLPPIRSVAWAAKDNGWFATARTESGFLVVYIDPYGRFHQLRESPQITWSVPSPDGKYLALVEQHLSSNLWRLSN